MKLNGKPPRAPGLARLESPRFWARALWVLLLLSLIPVLWISLYNHSCADDYAYGWLAHRAWVEEGSLWAVLKGALWQVADTYRTWQGTYAAVLLFALHPGIFGESFYCLNTFLLAGALLFSTLYLFRVLVGRLLRQKDLALLLSAAVLLLQFHLLPYPVEGLYWWYGSSFYVIFHALMLFQCGLMTTLLLEDRRSRGRAALCCLLGVACAGGNYVSALLTMEMTLLFLVLAFVTRRGRAKLSLITVLTLAGFLINVSAPGNAVRQAAYQQVPALQAILLSYRDAGVCALRWSRQPLLLLLLLFLAPFLWRLLREKLPRGLGLLPAAGLLALLFSAFASSFTPTEFAMGSMGAGRVQNIRFFLWVLLCPCWESVLLAAARRLLPARAERPERPVAALLLAVSLCACLVPAAYVLTGDWNRMTGLSASAALLSGSAREYDREAKARIELLLSSEGSAALPSFSRKPYLLFFDDIQPDPNDFRNSTMAAYYGLDQITLLPEGS